ncbi:hypothetical protein [Thalassospira sp.]|uniref:hypothetical protein n=1 Tax=Thalassospira sp. TaxID=1912094 RepID=UPI003AA96B9A
MPDFTGALPGSARKRLGAIISVTLLSGLLAACAGNAVGPGVTNTNYGKNTLNGASYNDGMAQAPARNATKKTDNTVPNNQAASLAARKPPIRPDVKPKKTAAIPFVQIKAASLANLDSKAIEAKLGKPEMQRGEGSAKVWQYRSDRCALDVFFYPQGGKKQPVLVHMLARLRDGNGEIALQDCLDEVVKDKQSHKG